jgi:thioredoxin reductase (NADPH)
MARGSWDVDCAVIGGGPGGLISGLYLKRFNRDVVVINAGRPRASWIPITRNLIGYSEGIRGKELLKRIHRQLDSHDVERLDSMASVARHRQGFEIDTDRGKIKARKVIIATGIRDIQPDLENL